MQIHPEISASWWSRASRPGATASVPGTRLRLPRARGSVLRALQPGRQLGARIFFWIDGVALALRRHRRCRRTGASGSGEARRGNEKPRHRFSVAKVKLPPPESLVSRCPEPLGTGARLRRNRSLRACGKRSRVGHGRHSATHPGRHGAGVQRSSLPTRAHVDVVAQQSDVAAHAAPSGTQAVVQWSTCSAFGTHFPAQHEDVIVQDAPSTPQAPVDAQRRTPRLVGWLEQGPAQH